MGFILDIFLYAIIILGIIAILISIISMTISYIRYKNLTQYMLEIYNNTFNKLTQTSTAAGTDAVGDNKAGDGKAGDGKAGDGKAGDIPTPSSANIDAFFEKEQNRSFKMMGIVVGTQLAIQLGPKIAKILGPKIVATKVAQSVGRISVQLASKTLTKLAEKLGPTALAKLGARVSEKIAARVAESVAIKAASKMATSAALKASVILAPIGLAMDAIAIVSIGLDMADVGGYMKMGTLEMYKAIRQDIWDNYKKAFTDNKIEFPLIFGPIDKMAEKDPDRFNKDQSDAINAIVSNMDDPLMSKLKDAVSNYMTDNPDKTPADLDTYITDNFDKLVDMDAILNKATTKLCSDYRGKMVQNKCTYATPSDCKSSMVWPPTEESKDTYVEWDPDTKTCNVASIGMYSVCMDARLGYDWNKRNCNITQDYCLSKGAKWGYNSDIDEFDCIIPKDQEVFESIFGTTMTRGAIQIFDPDQYCPCPAGTNEVPPYLCDTCPADASERIGALCYEKCPDGYVSSGFGCRKPCPTDGRFTDTLPLTCNKNSFIAYKRDCPSHMRDDGTSCWLDTYGNGIGTIPNVSCDPGWNLQGFAGDATWCDQWRCTAWAPDWLGGGCVWQDVFTQAANVTCPSGKINVAGLCYDKCKPGYHFVGGNLCEPDGGPGIKITLMDRQYCPAGYTNFAGVCWADCPWSNSDGGVFCNRPGYERDPKPLVTTTKKRRIALSTKDSDAVTTGNC